MIRVQRVLRILGPALVVAALLLFSTVTPVAAAPTFLTLTMGSTTGANIHVSSNPGAHTTVVVRVDDAPGQTVTITVTNVTRGVTLVPITLTETSEAGTVPGTVQYTGTASNSNNFSAVPTANENLSSAPRAIGANHGNLIQVVATPLVAVLTVDSVGPTMGDLVPSNGTITRSQLVTFSGTVTDASSGIPDTTSQGSETAPASGTIVIKVDDVDRTNLASFTQVTDGFSFSLPLFLQEGTHTWQVTAKDTVGNMVLTDSNKETICDPFNPTSSTCEKHDLEIDTTPPALAQARTGENWDPASGTIKRHVSTSLRLIFDKQGAAGIGDALKAETLSPLDFLVGEPGVTPSGLVFPNLKAGAAGNSTGTDLRNDLF